MLQLLLAVTVAEHSEPLCTDESCQQEEKGLFSGLLERLTGRTTDSTDGLELLPNPLSWLSDLHPSDARKYVAQLKDVCPTDLGECRKGVSEIIEDIKEGLNRPCFGALKELGGKLQAALDLDDLEATTQELHRITETLEGLEFMEGKPRLQVLVDEAQDAMVKHTEDAMDKHQYLMGKKDDLVAAKVDELEDLYSAFMTKKELATTKTKKAKTCHKFQSLYLEKFAEAISMAPADLQEAIMILDSIALEPTVERLTSISGQKALVQMQAIDLLAHKYKANGTHFNRILNELRYKITGCYEKETASGGFMAKMEMPCPQSTVLLPLLEKVFGPRGAFDAMGLKYTDMRGLLMEFENIDSRRATTLHNVVELLDELRTLEKKVEENFQLDIQIDTLARLVLQLPAVHLADGLSGETPLWDVVKKQLLHEFETMANEIRGFTKVLPALGSDFIISGLAHVNSIENNFETETMAVMSVLKHDVWGHPEVLEALLNMTGAELNGNAVSSSYFLPRQDIIRNYFFAIVKTTRNYIEYLKLSGLSVDNYGLDKYVDQMYANLFGDGCKPAFPEVALKPFNGCDLFFKPMENKLFYAEEKINEMKLSFME